MALSDRTSELDYARDVGMERGMRRGMKKGRTEGILEIARKMKNAGKPLNEIIEFTGLSVETIEQM